MKIVFISSLLPTGHYSQILLEGLSRQKDLQFVVYTDTVDENISIKSGVVVKEVWTKGIGYIYAILKELDTDKPDIVHVQHELNMYGGPVTAILFPVLLLLIRLKGYKTLATIHGTVGKKQITTEFIDQFMMNKPFYINVVSLRLFFQLIYSAIGLFTDRVVCHTQRMKTILVQDYNLKDKNIIVIPTAIPAKKILQIPRQKYFFYFGYMVRRKGIEYLLKGFKLFSKQYPEYKLIMAGGVIKGQEHALEEIKQQIAALGLDDCIEIKGFIKTETELAKLYGGAYAVVIPARISIAASGPLYQAQGYHKCILASDVGNFKEEVEHLKTGMLVQNDQWNKAFENVARDIRLVEKLEKGSANRALEKSQVKITQHYFSLYKTL